MTNNNIKFSYAYFHNVHTNIKRADFAIRFTIKENVIAWFNADCFDESYTYETSWVFRGIR